MTAPVTAPKRGRPPIDGEPRSADHRIRCTPGDLETWRAAAELEGVELAEVTRDLLDAWAERVLTGELSTPDEPGAEEG